MQKKFKMKMKINYEWEDFKMMDQDFKEGRIWGEELEKEGRKDLGISVDRWFNSHFSALFYLFRIRTTREEDGSIFVQNTQ